VRVVVPGHAAAFRAAHPAGVSVGQAIVGAGVAVALPLRPL
jgi:hypothetical protein